ncbi:GerAB/ArcD/ProY family transporter [Sediminibacillus albus]|uniref:Spore germination protein (Amino acid permease) n=1 Tax=Sediminibacillus albus TaxID=407036 RepID=A0A1G9C9L1_9BACI|nr:GerAB/ArcD/ProY family transporter [Sediminibacillus albus]SDK48347.1 spore germination protein (amino acid permease) [Sediminibacillus albus]
MPGKKNEKITRRQFFFVVIQTEIGVGVLSLPFDLHQAAKQDGWISLLLAGLVIQIIILAMWLTARMFPHVDLFGILPRLFGRGIGSVLSFVYCLYFIAVCVLALLLFGRMLHLWILPNTPFWILSSCLAFISFYLISSGLVVMARIYTFVSILLFIMFALLLAGVNDMQLIYLLPIGQATMPELAKGIQGAGLAMLGFISFYILYPQTEGTPVQRLKTMSLANLFVVTFYLLVVLITFGYFSTAEMALVPQPVLYLLKGIELKIISRVDLFLLSMWIVSVATSFSTYLYMSSIGLSVLFHSKKIRRFAFFSTMLAISISIYIGIEEQPIDKFSLLMTNLSIAFTGVIPLLLMVYAVVVYRIVRRKKDGKA